MNTNNSETTTDLCNTLRELNETMYHDDIIEVAIHTLESQVNLVNELTLQSTILERDNKLVEDAFQCKLKTIAALKETILRYGNDLYLANATRTETEKKYAELQQRYQELEQENNRLHKYNDHLINERAAIRTEAYKLYDEKQQATTTLEALQEKIKEEKPKIEVIKRKSALYDNLLNKYEKKFGKRINKKF